MRIINKSLYIHYRQKGYTVLSLTTHLFQVSGHLPTFSTHTPIWQSCFRGWVITTTLPWSWLQNIKDQAWVELHHLQKKFPQLVWLHICYDLLESVSNIKHTESPNITCTTSLKTKIKISIFTTIMYLHKGIYLCKSTMEIEMAANVVL